MTLPVWYTALPAGLTAAAFLTTLGLPVARAVAPLGIAPLGLAPALGWALYSALLLPVLSITGFSPLAVTSLSLLALAVALCWLRFGARPETHLPGGAVALAAALALLPAMSILPKISATGVRLSPPIFDHVKIAVVDAVLRDGLPVSNPFYGPGGPGHLAYYYLWHVSVAAGAAALHVSAWTAEAAMTGFTGFAALLLVFTLAQALAGRAAAGFAAMLLCLPGSLRTLLTAALGSEGGHRLIPRESDIGGWLNQAAWVPQHLASACCLLLCVLLLLRLAQKGSWVVAGVLGVVTAAGFESSVWIGGIAFAAAGGAVGLALLRPLAPAARLRFISRGALAAVIAAVLIAPFIIAELGAVAARAGGSPVALMPYPALGKALPPGWRLALDVPAFWLIMLPFDLPAIAPLGLLALVASWRRPPDAARRDLIAVLGMAILACLAVACLLRSTIDNNDLGWRAALPAVLLLAAFAGAALVRLRGLALSAALAAAALGVPQMLSMVQFYVAGAPGEDPGGFAATAPMWRAVREVSGPDERVANHPLLARGATPWPVNISWALLSDRPSCYAGWTSVVAYGALSHATLGETSARFVRVFNGNARPDDVHILARGDDCAVALVTRLDGAWAADPFAGSADYKLAATGDSYRVYHRIPAAPAEPMTK